MTAVAAIKAPHFSLTALNHAEVKAGRIAPQKLDLASREQLVKHAAQPPAAGVSLVGEAKPAIQPPTVALDSKLLEKQLVHQVPLAVPVSTPSVNKGQADSGKFSIATLANSFVSQLGDLAIQIASSLLKAREGETQLSASMQKISVSLAETSAEHSRAAGKAAASQAMTAGVISIAGGAAGLKTSANAYRHGKFNIASQRDMLSYQQQSKALTSQLHSTPVAGMAPGQLAADREIIRGAAIVPLEHKGQLAGVQATVHQNKSAKLNNQATATTQMSHQGGQVAATPFQVEQAEHHAEATLADTAKQVTDNTRSKVEEAKQRDGQLMQQLMSMLYEAVNTSMNTAGNIATTRA
ncbi:hypothetical protein [Serratia quinivorans]|uniref:hypothetical protein n=1 Tax=Serratia quinivorans TaxID=137545 RepID=UPI003981F6C5